MNKLIAAVAVFAVIASFVALNSSNEDVGPLVIYFPTGKDFANTDEGKATLEFKFPQEEFKVGDELADILMFLESRTIQGLRILYNQKERKIYAGIPSMVSGEVMLLDGNIHTLEYSFSRTQKLQSLSLDGSLLASGEYTGPVTVLTGNIVSWNFRAAESDIPIEVSIE